MSREDSACHKRGRQLSRQIRKLFWTFLFLPSLCLATTYNSNGTVDNIRSIHDNQAHHGDTITIPAGTFSWNSPLNITKGITLQGAGIGNTTISADPLAANGTLVRISCGSNFVSMSNISWIGNAAAQGATVVVGNSIHDVNINYRLHHMSFLVNKRGLLLLGKCEGLVDHCTFRCTLNAACQGVTVWGDAQYHACTREYGGLVSTGHRLDHGGNLW